MGVHERMPGSACVYVGIQVGTCGCEWAYAWLHVGVCGHECAPIRKSVGLHHASAWLATHRRDGTDAARGLHNRETT